MTYGPTPAERAERAALLWALSRKQVEHYAWASAYKAYLNYHTTPLWFWEVP